MNTQWLGLVLPLTCVLFFLIYFSFLPAVYGEEGYPEPLRKILDFWHEAFPSDIFATVVIFILALPIILIVLILGGLQTTFPDSGIRWFSVALRVMGVLWFYGLFKYFF